MIKSWTERTSIVANLLNPAFCGEILRRFIKAYNSKSDNNTPFILCFIVLPILLHKDTRELLPSTTKSHVFTWIDSNDPLFINFQSRVKDLNQFTKDSLMFLLSQGQIRFDENAELVTKKFKTKSLKGDETEEVEVIFQKAEFLGKWLSKTSDIKTLFTFLRITP